MQVSAYQTQKSGKLQVQKTKLQILAAVIQQMKDFEIQQFY